MIHNKYKASYKGIDREVGLLGECHLYRREEIAFAWDVIEQYDSIVCEGGTENKISEEIATASSLFLIPEALIFGPIYFSIGRRHITPFAHPRGLAFGRDVVEARDLTARGTVGWTLGTPLRVIGYIAGVLNAVIMGDPHRHDTPAGFEKTKNHEDGYYEPNSFNRFLYDLDKRDAILAETGITCLDKGSKRVLIHSGLAHSAGIKRNLEAKIGKLEKVATEHPVYED